MSISSLTVSNTSCFSHNWFNWSSRSFPGTTLQNFQGTSGLLSDVSRFQHHGKLCSKCNYMIDFSCMIEVWKTGVTDMYMLLLVLGWSLRTELTLVISSIPGLLEQGNWVNSVPMLWGGQLENWSLISGVDRNISFPHCLGAALESTQAHIGA